MNKSPEAFRTISEVSRLLDTPPHVLRFWQKRFKQLRPVQRPGGGHRYYSRADIDLLRGLKQLLHVEKQSIPAVQLILREKGKGFVASLMSAKSDTPQSAAPVFTSAVLPNGETAGEPLAKTPRVSTQLLHRASNADELHQELIAVLNRAIALRDRLRDCDV